MERTHQYENEHVVRARDFLVDSCSDTHAIQQALCYAKEKGVRTVLLDKKDWLLDRAIELPSNTTVIADGVLIKQVDGILDNLFRPGGMEINPEDPYGFPLSIQPTESIRILGKNGAGSVKLT